MKLHKRWNTFLFYLSKELVSGSKKFQSQIRSSILCSHFHPYVVLNNLIPSFLQELHNLLIQASTLAYVRTWIAFLTCWLARPDQAEWCEEKALSALAAGTLATKERRGLTSNRKIHS